MDFDVHGFAGVRVIDGTAGDLAAVEADLGPLQRELERDPDIVVRFVNRLEGGPLRLVGLDDSGHDEDGFYLLRGRHGAAVRVLLPLDRVGGRCEIVCESGVSGVPLLRAVVNMAALANGAVPVHGAAFEHEGKGALVTGWSRGGKTEVLLAFMTGGARYVGDEWVYVDPSGSTLHGTHEPVTLWDWNLDDLPAYAKLIPPGRRARMRAVRRAVGRGRSRRALVRKAVELAERRGSVRIPPDRLFGADSCIPSCTFDELFLAVSHESYEVTTRPADPEEIARSMVACMLYEHRDLIAQYLKFRFAFPDRRSETLDRLEELYADGLARVFSGKRAHVVAHPYPARVPSLQEAMRTIS